MNQHSTEAPSAPARKQVLRKEIGQKLAGALADYKEELGDKKYATRVKEVSKLISRDLLKISKKQKRNGKKTAVKTPKTPKPPKKTARVKNKKETTNKTETA